jgi:rhamnose transport system permease protein
MSARRPARRPVPPAAARPRAAPRVARRHARPRPRAQPRRRRSRSCCGRVTTLANPRFLNSQNLRDILLNVSIVALLAVGQTVVSSRATSTSRSARCSAHAFLTGVLFADHHGMADPARRSSPGSLSARSSGCSTARWSRSARVPSLVITLGTLYVIRGVDFLWAKGPPDQRRRHARRLPEARHATRSSASRCCR